MKYKDILSEDMNDMENAMTTIRLYGGTDLWQNRLILQMCKAIYDIIGVLMKMKGDEIGCEEKEHCAEMNPSGGKAP